MWDLIVSVPDHCLSFLLWSSYDIYLSRLHYFIMQNNINIYKKRRFKCYETDCMP